MPANNFTSAYERMFAEISSLHAIQDSNPNEALSLIRLLVDEISSSEVTSVERGYLNFSCSSVLINCGSRIGDGSAIDDGRELAENALRAFESSAPVTYQCRCNIANAILARSEVDLVMGGGDRQVWEPILIENRMRYLEELRTARSILFEIAESDEADTYTRSSAYCNLANTLDTSGRWAEAYNFYLRALEVDPTSGNAAGNIAQLLRYRIEFGVGHLGHLAAVFNHYVNLAQQQQAGAANYAGQHVADQWSGLEAVDEVGHFAHGYDSDSDAYLQWVVMYRLALSPVVEGVGTDYARWDIATLEPLYGGPEDLSTPEIVGEMNVLKADFLVSRRLAFDAIAEIGGFDLSQPDTDTGYYVETFDHSLYGASYSRLILSQRSTLDVLDKTAVIANEYFSCGERPSQVNFRKFWTDASGALRSTITRGPGRKFPALALAELALDMGREGMYAQAQALRNAGTHRIVHAALDNITGVTDLSRSRIDLLELISSTILALQVTRSAYMYLIDLVAMWNHPDDHPGQHVSISMTEYSPRTNYGEPNLAAEEVGHEELPE